MRKSIGIGGFGAIAIALMFVTTTAPIIGAAPTLETTVDLIAGQNTDVGYVHVWYEDDYFYLDIVLDVEGWTLIDSHVAMSVDTTPDSDGCDLNGIPKNKQGQPVPGHFPYEPYETGDTYARYEISFSDVGYADHNDDFVLGEDEVCIAVHAVVEKTVNGITQQQTGWGDGQPFGKSWAMYFCWEPLDYKTLSLPSTVTAIISHSGGTYDCGVFNCYWQTVVTSGGSGNLPNSASGTYYMGWCVDLGVTIAAGNHTFNVYAYYDTNMPADEQTNHWNQINYFLNNKGDLTPTQFQRVIWYYCHEGSIVLSVHEQAHVTAAEADGAASFVPQVGDWAAVLLQYSTAQSIIIEVDP